MEPVQKPPAIQGTHRTGSYLPYRLHASDYCSVDSPGAGDAPAPLGEVAAPGPLHAAPATGGQSPTAKPEFTFANQDSPSGEPDARGTQPSFGISAEVLRACLPHA